MRYFNFKTYLLIGGTIVPSIVSAQKSKDQTTLPNILCIVVDDLGYGDLSCQGFAKDIRTPQIDKLLNGGCRFTNFYANSNVSSPSRAALLTGRYPDMVGVPGVIRTDEKDSWGYLSPQAVLLPKTLKQAGYYSAIVGKWHLGLESPNTPTEKGFDYFHGFLGDMMDDYYTHLREGHNYMRENLEEIHPEQKHATELFSDWAIDFLNSQKKNTKPFFLYLAYNAPHTPIQAPEKYINQVKKQNPSITEGRANLVALIEHLDDNVGRVISTLEKNKQLDNTLIIFVSDNGGDTNANNGPVRGQKGQMYEGGLRIPAGFYWKGKINPSTTENFAMLSDIFPSVCELAGIKNDSGKVDGISILPTIFGKSQSTDNRFVYWVRREGGATSFGGKACYASRYKNYKILQNTPFSPLEFFDLSADPMEQQPIENKASKSFINLSQELMDHIHQTGSIPWQRP